MKKVILLIVFISSTMLLKAAEFAGGNGTAEDPYQVADAHHLNNVRNYLDKHFVQVAHIDVDVSPYNMGNYWIPIGGNRNNNHTDANFTGTYNGNGYLISNLTIVQPGNNNVGLFGHIGAGEDRGTVLQNIHLENVIIIGGRGTGALVGRVTGNQNTRIDNCSVELGYVRGDGATGGLIGSNNSYMQASLAAEGFRPQINTSFADVTVFLRSENSQGKDKFGGLVGCNQKGMILNSFSLGDVVAEDAEASYVGGLAGCINSRGMLVNSYSFSAVIAEEAAETGGLVGGLGTGRNKGMIINSYWNTSKNPVDFSIDAGIGLSTGQMQQADSYSQWDFMRIWDIAEDQHMGLPFHQETEGPKSSLIWTGNADNNWQNPANWEPQEIPSVTSSVVVVSERANSPVIQSSLEINIMDIAVNDGAELMIGEGALLNVTHGVVGASEGTGTGRITGPGALRVTGSENSILAPAIIENLIVDHATRVALTGNIRIISSLDMQQGLLDLSGYDIDLQEGGMLYEREMESGSSRVYGLGGVIRTIRDIDSPDGEIGGLGLEIFSDHDLGTTLVERGHSELNAGDKTSSILRWFNIEPYHNEGLDATLVFHYFTAELNTAGEDYDFSLIKKNHDESEWTWVPSQLNALEQTITASHVDGFSVWTAGTGNNPLPIVLLSFEGEAKGSYVELTWITGAEINNDYFTVERSANGVSFEPVATVKGAGTTSQTGYYAAKDHRPVEGVAYYRLKQTDFNGEYEYSDIISVHAQTTVADDIRLYPNPNNGTFNILLGGETAIEFTIYDMQGRSIHTAVAEPGLTKQVHLPQLPRGVYTVVFFTHDVFTRKIQVF